MSSKKKSCNIFISHSSENKAIAEQFSALLNSIGIERNRIFCSSIIGQGVDNGEKLNSAIAKAIYKSSLIIYVISHDFIKSSYCMEELGVGWFLDIRGKATCYYLVLPDIELSELKGFVNSKIDKFSFVDKKHTGDLSLLAENICDFCGKKKKKHSALLNIEKTFFSAIDSLLDELMKQKKERTDEENKRIQRVYELEDELDQYKEDNKNQSASLASYKQDNERLRNEIKENKLRIELETIEKRFAYLGFGSGIEASAFRLFSKDFWFSMLNRYYELTSQLGKGTYAESMEMLAATIYSADGNYDKAYEHLVEYVRINDSSIYPFLFKNIIITDDNTMDEILIILKEKMSTEPEGLTRDSYSDTIRFINERNKKLKEAPNA